MILDIWGWIRASSPSLAMAWPWPWAMSHEASGIEYQVSNIEYKAIRWYQGIRLPRRSGVAWGGVGCQLAKLAGWRPLACKTFNPFNDKVANYLMCFVIHFIIRTWNESLFCQKMPVNTNKTLQTMKTMQNLKTTQRHGGTLKELWKREKTDKYP